MLTIENIKKNLETEVQQIKLYIDYIKNANVQTIINGFSVRDALSSVLDGRARIKVYMMQLFNLARYSVQISDDWQISYND